MTAFRREHPVLRGNAGSAPWGWPEISFHHGAAWNHQTESYTRQIGILFAGQKENGEDDCVLLCINAHWEDHEQELPEPPSGMRWRLAFHTACEKPFASGISLDAGRFVIGARSVAAAVLEPAGS